MLVLPILLPGRRFSWASYYPSRLLRLYDPVIAAVILAFVKATVFVRRTWPGISSWLPLHAGGHPIGRAALDAALVGGTSTLSTPLWSLSLEVLFSLLFPLYVLLVQRFRPHSLTLGVLLLIADRWAIHRNGYLLYLSRVRDRGHLRREPKISSTRSLPGSVRVVGRSWPGAHFSSSPPCCSPRVET